MPDQVLRGFGGGEMGIFVVIIKLMEIVVMQCWTSQALADN